MTSHRESRPRRGTGFGLASIRITVNREAHDLEVDPMTPLLWVLRDRLGLTGTKYGCGVSLCGACTVFIDRTLVRACTVAAGDVGDSLVTTIEGIWSHPLAGKLHRSWVDEQVPQCGYCQSGQIMAALALLIETPAPSDEQIDAALAGNLCRCGTYARIRRAIHRAAAS